MASIVAGDVPTLNQNTTGSSGSCTGNAATATNVAYSGLTGTVPTWNQNTTGNAATATYSNAANSNWVSAPIASSISGSTSSVQVKNNGGTGDSNVAALAFHCTGTYATLMHLRADGYLGWGGWSAGVWKAYINMGTGDFTAAGNVTAYSDPKLKENIKPITSALSKVQQLNGVHFTWKHGIPHNEGKEGKEDVGILADEVEAVFPELVSQSIELEGESYKTVAYDKLVPLLIEAIKELKAEVDELKKAK
jgi:hypothetical protein